jgi:hypothetical protein
MRSAAQAAQRVGIVVLIWALARSAQLSRAVRVLQQKTDPEGCELVKGIRGLVFRVDSAEEGSKLRLCLATGPEKGYAPVDARATNTASSQRHS